jgi:hypothetical protein
MIVIPGSHVIGEYLRFVPAHTLKCPLPPVPVPSPSPLTPHRLAADHTQIIHGCTTAPERWPTPGLLQGWAGPARKFHGRARHEKFSTVVSLKNFLLILCDVKSKLTQIASYL